jgi:hypothetical protein
MPISNQKSEIENPVTHLQVNFCVLSATSNSEVASPVRPKWPVWTLWLGVLLFTLCVTLLLACRITRLKPKCE